RRDADGAWMLHDPLEEGPITPSHHMGVLLDQNDAICRQRGQNSPHECLVVDGSAVGNPVVCRRFRHKSQRHIDKRCPRLLLAQPSDLSTPIPFEPRLRWIVSQSLWDSAIGHYVVV